MSGKSIVLTILGVLGALGIAAAVTIPIAADRMEKRHNEFSTYETGAAAKQGRASVPRWLPDEATSVRYAMNNTGGQRLLKVTLPSGSLPAGCTPQSASAAKDPQIKADWFPSDARSKATARCGMYDAYMEGDTLYAWQHNDDWVESNKTGAAS
ncbi:hypothetical protein DEJ50_05475 [Streptomyces venezuelae]|uniref:Uncharacterized protein n=1 Tax=Streptomyces venezuelae TaxID=54571 RepID=A0A5P2CZG6_STRVZ|nr:hypothetical protein [Streptomyces venezuelae]QES47357.1 hypothetical protein DEJ50_05475 [Streptomyces venezuelae]